MAASAKTNNSLTSAMRLILSNDSPENTTISDSTTGQVLYRFSTPSGKGIVNIFRVVPNDSDGDHMKDRFEQLAQIEWYDPTTSIFRYRGQKYLTTEFFKHEGKSERRRSFIAADGRAYVWVLSTHTSSLELHDNSRTLIARSYRQKHMLSGPPEARKAYIEISLGGEHIRDDIAVTWAFAESVRRALELGRL
ncbi:hypothetical protein PILCRDRAFT_823128 [Piloderma croceum F 1598]|uniref:DUF6593 domain-containing protein n=1 Tax=Piloderma croceum (strain F 1598) TaxID=765440 RepID=A0A0C3B042_PILCF|nr:hypothetical protein PILCRDRAFT_823128 [Piloderma croceum F 1598]